MTEKAHSKVFPGFRDVKISIERVDGVQMLTISQHFPEFESYNCVEIPAWVFPSLVRDVERAINASRCEDSE